MALATVRAACTCLPHQDPHVKNVTFFRYNAIYDQMMASVYFAVGICSARALKNPIRHASFLWFVALSSVSHGLVMLFHALHDDAHINHLIGDVWILAGAASLAWPLWRSRRADDGYSQFRRGAAGFQQPGT